MAFERCPLPARKELTSVTTLRGQVVAVIGGANGIGKEISRQLVVAGAKVAIGDRDQTAATRTAGQLRGELLALAVDVTDPESVDEYLTDIEKQWGRVDVVVNSAGVMSVGPFDAESTTATRAQLDVNLFGAINVIKAIAPDMRARGAGHIIVLASAASLLPTPGEASYAASKHGVYGYMKAVRAELRGSGVELTIVMPTVVDTALAAGTSSGAATMLQPADVAQAVLKAIQRPRFEVAIPRYLSPARRAIDILPTRLRDAIYRRLVPDQVHASDPTARADYEASQLGDPK